MKKTAIFIFSFLLQIAFIFAQEKVAPQKYRIQFADKANSPYKIERPQEFLSYKSLLRRFKQNLPITEFDLPISPAYLDSIRALGLKIISHSHWLNSVVVEVPDSQIINKIPKLHFITTYSDWKAKQTGVKKYYLQLPIEPLLHKKKIETANYFYGASFNQIEMLNGRYLHALSFNGNEMLAAVLDGGFFQAHKLPSFKHLWKKNKIKGTRDFVDGDTLVFGDASHGMQVLSTMGACWQGEMVGTSPEADFWLLRSEETQSEYLIEEENWIAAAEFADSLGVDLINSSLGYSEFDDKTQNHTYKEMDGTSTRISFAAQIAAQTGMLIVTSAGNSGHEEWTYITAPADADNILTVGATDYQGNYASFSSIGPTSDGRIKPNVCAQGSFSIVQGTGDYISFSSGTSFSSPILAGMALCLWQARPELSNLQIIRAIEKSANNSFAPDNKLGYGIPNFQLAFLFPNGFEANQFEPINQYLIPEINNDNYILELFHTNADSIEIEIFDVSRQKLFSENISLNSKYYNRLFLKNLNKLEKGVYSLNLKYGNNKKTLIIVI